MKTTRVARLKYVGAASAAALLLALGACSSADDGGTGSGGDGGGDGDTPYVALVSKGFQHQFWQAVKQGADDAAEELGVEVTFEGPETETEVDKQLSMLQTALDKNPDAIGFAALDSEASIPLMSDAQSRGIPVVAFDSGVESDVPITTVSTDNEAAAAEAAKHMVELIGGSGKIAVLGHDQTSQTGQQRVSGFVDYIEENAPDVEIVDVQYAGGDQLKSADAAKSILQANPDLKGIYGTNEGAATGVVKAVQELGAAGTLTVIGFDSGKAQTDAIRDGLMAGAITQNPVGIGYETVKAAVAAINGEDVEPVIDSGFYWYDATNIDDEEIAAVLYE
ncbi:BMP family ABC transporter substrate-binding protein [Cellulosimicrobium cellulans]|uniref:BMP family ABC transporter substrate-binding protein n=1 Tax=Cellulosimicrobium cellulans TaxID=1710 RepID=A0A1Y0HTY9_CELCE|nr:MULTISPECIES: ABC transporter substrate-binding protein [Cellulosimicrobium]ARU51627.1 BMP family ABC transporter substrate-binding protein [Cellulosimicrobium cellulans]